jgi:hypothetical protein
MPSKKQPFLNNAKLLASLADTTPQGVAAAGQMFAQLAQHIDHSMVLTASSLDQAQTTHDQIFELMMARFDAAAPYYSALKAWWQILPKNGALKARAWAQVNYSAQIMQPYLKQSLKQSPPRLALIWIYWQSLQAFYNPQHPNAEQALDHTMVALEKALNTYENYSGGAILKQCATFFERTKGLLSKRAL